MNQLTVSLWGDEAFTAVAVRENFWRTLQIIGKDTHPPGYYFFLMLWTRLFGHSEISLRSLSVLFYLGTIVIVYLIAKHLWNKKTGLIAAWLTLANPFLFPFAFESRMYAIMLFFVTLSFYFFIRKKNTGYVLAAAAAIYSQHYAALAIIFQFGWRLMTAKKLAKNWFRVIKPYFYIGLLYTPWLYPLYKQVTLVSGGFWLGKPTLNDFTNLFIKYLQGEKLVYAWQKYWPYFTLPILLVKKWRGKKSPTLFLIGWAVIPVLIGWLISQGKTSIFYDRYMIFIIPSMMLLLAGGWRKVSLPFIMLFSLPLMWVNIYYFTHPTKRPFRQLAAYVKTVAEPNDYLINYNGSAHHLWETKYYGLTAPLYAPGGELPYYVGTAQMTDEDIIKSLPAKGRVGVISSENPNIMQIAGFKLDSYEQFGSLSFSWFTAYETR